MFRGGIYNSRSGQSVVEYFIFFAVIAALTFLSVCTLYPRAREACQDMYQEAINIDYMHSTPPEG